MLPILHRARAAAKSTGPLTEALSLPTPRPRFLSEPIPASLPDRDFFLRLAELVIFLVAVVGAVALGLAITTYFTAHTYIAAYLLAYAGFRCADLLVRDEYGPDPARDAVVRRVADQGHCCCCSSPRPSSAPFYGAAKRRAGSAGSRWRWNWAGYGSRSARAFSWASSHGKSATASISSVLVRSGFYRFIRHPAYAGIYLALIAWPIAYGAPISALLTIIIVGMVMRRLIKREENHAASSATARSIENIRTRATR